MKIKVLLVMPGKEVRTVKIPASIKFIKSFIGEELYRIKLNDNTVLIANKNAKVDEFNRILGGNILLGTFIIVSVKNKHRVSMKKKDIRTFTNMFKLRKHQKKIDIYKDEYLEEYYSNQRSMKQKNAERNKKEIFKIAA
jgi:predicted RNA-binding protein with PUA domain